MKLYAHEKFYVTFACNILCTLRNISQNDTFSIKIFQKESGVVSANYYHFIIYH